MKLFLIGSCQMYSYAALLKMAGYGDITTLRINEVADEHLQPGVMDGYDLILAHHGVRNRKQIFDAIKDHPNLITLPSLFFDGFTPDDEIRVSLSAKGPNILLSRIAVGAFRNGLSLEEALQLYSPGFCHAMDYHKVIDRAKRNLIAMLAPDFPNAEQLYAKWYGKGVFFHTSNHPKLFVVEDVLRGVLQSQTEIVLPPNLSAMCPDPLQQYAISPQFNHPAATNNLSDPNHIRKRGKSVVTCGDFLQECYDTLGKHKDTIVYDEGANQQFDAALKQWRAYEKPDRVVNPYRSKPDRAYWARTVSRPAREDVKPVGQTRQLISKNTRVATAGSCFAQHVARAMVANGLNYYVAEPAPDGMEETTAKQHTYGLFSARYGNIYSSKQLLQLIQRAYGKFQPVETAWEVKGGHVDPFRPNIGETFTSPGAVEKSRQQHLARVREMFEKLDVFVFTMGLTEGWVDLRDGAAFPVAPAAVSSKIDPALYGFTNSGYGTVRDEMEAFLDFLGRINPKANVILTVSPVPLVATYTESDVLSATTYSKSVLRAVAGDLASAYDNVCYFPSYEIITGNHARGEYFEEDLRSVRQIGVDHVMGVFKERLVITNGDTPHPETGDTDTKEPDADFVSQAEIVCDEEMLVR